MQVMSEHEAAVAAIEEQTAAAIDTLTAAHEQTIADVDAIETSSLDEVNALYTESYDAHVALGPHYADTADQKGERYTHWYESHCKIYNEDGTPKKDSSLPVT